MRMTPLLRFGLQISGDLAGARSFRCSLAHPADTLSPSREGGWGEGSLCIGFTKGLFYVLDHVTSKIAIASKIGIDATKKLVTPLVG